LKPPILRAAAAADVEEAYDWYEAQREGLGDEFLAAVQAALESILNHPEAAPWFTGRPVGCCFDASPTAFTIA
jgi:plasmid stabilization system protein ParE